jgi:hypothetical protein
LNRNTCFHPGHKELCSPTKASLGCGLSLILLGGKLASFFLWL